MEFLKQFWKNGSTCIVNTSLPKKNGCVEWFKGSFFITRLACDWNWQTYRCALNLLVNILLELEVGSIQTQLQKGYDVVKIEISTFMESIILFQHLFGYMNSKIYRNICKQWHNINIDEKVVEKLLKRLVTNRIFWLVKKKLKMLDIELPNHSGLFNVMYFRNYV